MSALTLNKYQIMPYLLASAWQGSSQMGPAVGLPRAAPERVLPLPPACSFLVEHYSDYRSHQTDPWAPEWFTESESQYQLCSSHLLTKLLHGRFSLSVSKFVLALMWPWFHRTGKGQFSFQSQRKVMTKNVQTTAQLHSFHTLAK